MRILISGIILLLVAFELSADWRCDCSQKVGVCKARISLQEKKLKIQTNTDKCAQVVWYANDTPNLATVTDYKYTEH